ncbi:phospholipase D-like domain-containing protein [Leptospira sarikeiensis]|uniref:phospholipase D n=1 Tax=Leptospira sarikeiensis TaxID=2484943 RepID=A0A4R9K3T2_9LEPT|nr:phospholipase D-like domain-containing protein [Leptospira sarikeiensis]TGL59554.1 PLD-like domain protein [Leptospira sarikeiensis]
MKKIFSLLATVLVLIDCEKTENDLDLFWEEDLYPKVFFSYPGRFTPDSKKRNVRDEILRIIKETKHSIYMHIYSFDDPEIEAELLNSNRRGVRLELMGEWGKQYPIALLPFLKYWKGSGLQHTKVLVSDENLVFLGTGNFTHYGLERDLNGYLEFRLDRKQWGEFLSFLREEYPYPKLRIAGLEFWNSPLEGNFIQNRMFDSVLSAKHSIRYLIFDHYDPVLSLALLRSNPEVLSGVYNRPIDPEGEFLSQFNVPEILEDGNEDILDDPVIGKGGLLHHKSMILDDLEVLTGSYNYSLSARDSNREIFIRTKDPRVANAFKEEWERIRNYSNSVTSFDQAPFNEGYIYDPLNKSICRSGTSNTGSFLEIGFDWFRWIQFYRWEQSEVCKSIMNYESISSRFFGGKSEFPEEGAEELGIRSFSRSGRETFKIPKSNLMAEFKTAIRKNAFFLRPEYFIAGDGAFLFPNNSEFDSGLSEGEPKQAWVLERGELPKKMGISLDENVYFLSQSLNSNSGVILLEYEDFGIYFCYRSINSNLHWPEEILFSVLNSIEDSDLQRKYERSKREFFSEEGLPNRRRKNLCAISF